MLAVVLTFGCAIAEELKHCTYTQFLGVLDGLGVLNSWGHQPERHVLVGASLMFPRGYKLNNPCDRVRNVQLSCG